MDLAVLAHNLKILRKSRGFTQENIAALLNIQRQSYCNYETGRRAPHLEVLIALANLYHVTLDFLVTPLSEYNASDSDSASFYSIEQLLSDYQSLSEDKQKEIQTFISYQKYKSQK